ncbi:MAG: DUF362 domain-containing protein [Clostridiales bacterium]|nr:DUF362 domain-containing protein [Clostridiales bacterium]
MATNPNVNQNVKPHVLYAPLDFSAYEVEQTLPARFERLLDKSGLREIVNGKVTAIKMHVGRNAGFTTIHPLFVKILTDRLKAYGAEKLYITDQEIDSARARGYTEEFLGVPILDACGFTGKYFYEKQVDFQTFKNVDVAGYIHDAEVLIDLSHVKGHGCCGFGGAVKNIAMGCVTDRTRGQIHRLEGGIPWDESKCVHCDKCVASCNHGANSFDENGKYEVNFHHCTFCQHCVKVCPTGALSLDDSNFDWFQTGMALCTQSVLDTFAPNSAYYVNFLMNITAVCDCWGMSTPSLVPDIGVMASTDIVAVERASLDAIKVENFIRQGAPSGSELGATGHLLERLHGKNPFIQLDALEKLGLGRQEYELVTVR